MASQKKRPGDRKPVVVTEKHRADACSLLLAHANPIVQQAADVAIQKVLAAEISGWSLTDVRKHVLWVIRQAAEFVDPQNSMSADQWAEHARHWIEGVLDDPRATTHISKASGLKIDLVRAAIVAWTIPRGRRGSGARTANSRQKELEALELLHALGLAESITVDAIGKLIDRHVGRRSDAPVRLGPK